MQAKNVTRVDLWMALHHAGKQFEDNLRFGRKPEPAGPRGDWLGFTLGVRSSDLPGVARSRGSLVACDHAHRAFFRALFELAADPEAVVISTSRVTYRGRAQFEAVAASMDRGAPCTCKAREAK